MLQLETINLYPTGKQQFKFLYPSAFEFYTYFFFFRNE
jgi:hypothetical protein